MLFKLAEIIKLFSNEARKKALWMQGPPERDHEIIPREANQKLFSNEARKKALGMQGPPQRDHGIIPFNEI